MPYTYKVPEGVSLIGITFLVDWIAQQTAPHFMPSPYCSDPEQKRAIVIGEIMGKHIAAIEERLEAGNLHGIDTSDRLPTKKVTIDTCFLVEDARKYLESIGYGLEFEPWPESAKQSDSAKDIQTKPQQWKMQVQTIAADLWSDLRASGANPTVASICPLVAKKCREFDIRTDSNINPSQNYLRTHVLSAKYWTPPQ